MTGIISLVFGILGVLASYWYVGILLGAVGLTLGIVDMSDSFSDGKSGLIGLLLSILGMVLSIYFVASDMDSGKLIVAWNKTERNASSTEKEDNFMRFHKEGWENEIAAYEQPQDIVEEAEAQADDVIDEVRDMDAVENTQPDLQDEPSPSVAIQPDREWYVGGGEEKQPEVNADSSKGDIQILSEYTLPDSIGWYTRHFMVIKNNSNETRNVYTSSIAYGGDGSMVSAADSSFMALGSGCTSVIYEAFETKENISRYDTNIQSEISDYYDSVIQNLSYRQNNIDNGAIFQVTNNGNTDAEFVEGYALFLLNGNLVDYQSAYFTDNDSELKAGNTISKQFTPYKEYDSIEFYLTGRKSKW